MLCVEIGGTGLLAGIKQRQAILDAVRELVVDRIQRKTLEMSQQQVTLSESENKTQQNTIDDCVFFCPTISECSKLKTEAKEMTINHNKTDKVFCVQISN